MAELTIDTTQLVEAAVTAVFAQSNPQELAKAMAQTALQHNRYGRETVLQEIIGSAVTEVTRGVIKKILAENEEAFKEKLWSLMGNDVINYCAEEAAKKMRGPR